MSGVFFLVCLLVYACVYICVWVGQSVKFETFHCIVAHLKFMTNREHDQVLGHLNSRYT